MNTDPIPQTPALHELLQAAAAPALPGELRGEAAALAAFRAAHRPVTETRSVPFMNRMTRVLTVKAAALTIAVTGMGGVALAAGTGTLPVPADTPIVGSEAKAEKKAKKAKADHEEKVRDWSGLCTAATEGNALNNPGKAAESTAFTRLITAAGGITQVPAFCAGILGTTLPPVENPVATAEEIEHGKSAGAGKENAPGQTKPDGEPATGKGKASAPGQVKKEGQTAPGASGEEHGESATAPGQTKSDGEPATGKGSGKAAEHRQGPKPE